MITIIMIGKDIVIDKFIGISGHSPWSNGPNIRVRLAIMPATKFRLIREVNSQLATPFDRLGIHNCRHYPILADYEIPRLTTILVCTELRQEREYQTMTAEEFYEDSIYDTPIVQSVMWAYFTLKFTNVTSSPYRLGPAIIYDSVEVIDIDYSITAREVNRSIDDEIDLYNEYFM
jgi:hypothetical protein